MNCTTCGGPNVLGTDMHANCRAEERQKAWEEQKRQDDIDALGRRVTELEAKLEFVLSEMGVE